MLNYFKETIKEMKKVNWPNGDQTNKDTISVIFLSLFFSAFLSFIGYLFSIFIKLLIK